MTGRPTGVDVVDLARLQRLYRDHPDDVTRRLGFRAAAGHPADVPALAASLAAGECWIKSRGGRPPGWRHSDARLETDVTVEEATRRLGETLQADTGLAGLRFDLLHPAGDELPYVVAAGSIQSWWLAAVIA